MIDTMDDDLPFWLQEHCTRLHHKDATLTNLNLNIRRLDHPMMQALAQALCASDVLVVLNLTSSLLLRASSTTIPAPTRRVTAGGMESVALDGDEGVDDEPSLAPLADCALPHTSGCTLRVLHLSYNKLRDARGRLGRALSQNHHLVELHLDHNCLASNAARHLARGLHNHARLRVLQLSYNPLGDDGVSFVAEALPKNTALHTLGLGSTGMQQVGAQALIRTLRHGGNMHLQKCDLQGNGISAALETKVRVSCAANRAGRRLLLWRMREVAGTDGNNAYRRECLLPWILARARDGSHGMRGGGGGGGGDGGGDVNTLFFLLQESSSMLVETRTIGAPSRKRVRTN